MNVWRRIAEIISQKEYSDSDLKAILRGWRELLEDSFAIPEEKNALNRDINRTLQKLKIKADREGEGILLETLRCILHCKQFNADDLDRFLIEAGVKYHYVCKKGFPLQKGEFMHGYRREIKPKMTTAFDCVFISHAYADREINNLFVDLLADIGLKREQIFYSSLPEYGVVLGDNIADAIRIKLSGKKVHMIYMLSKNYYKSVMCLNEMGAAWILQHTYTSVLLPGFKYRKIKGAVDPGNLGMKLGEDEGELKGRLIQLRNQLQKEFCLPSMDEIVWNRKVDNFLRAVREKTDR